MNFKDEWTKICGYWKIQREKEAAIIEEQQPEPKPTLPKEVAEYFMDDPLELGCFPARAVTHKRMIEVYNEVMKLRFQNGVEK